MTLNITASQIQIKNSSGQVKFTSNDKLLYLLKESTGTVTVSGQTNTGIDTQSTYGIDSYNSSNLLPIISIKINSCTGENFPSSLLGVITPANRSIIVHFAAGAVNKGLSRVSPYGNMGILSVTPTYYQSYTHPVFGYTTNIAALTFTSLMYNDQWAQPVLYDFGLNVTYYYRLYSYR